jgi:hypothetical protein
LSLPADIPGFSYVDLGLVRANVCIARSSRDRFPALLAFSAFTKSPGVLKFSFLLILK